MSSHRWVRRLLSALLVVVVLSLVLGQILGQPILLGYVATGSMSPTLEAGDGFVAVPDALSGEIDEGDVIVFEAQEVNEGELTTHRVVEVTDDGYVTRGDANPFTDQDGGEPPVTDGQVVATALEVNGWVVTIPHLGTAVTGVQSAFGAVVGALSTVVGVPGELDGDGAGAMLVGIGIALLGLGLALERVGPTRRETSRSRSRENVIAIWVAIALVLLVLVTLATAAMVVPSGTTGYGLVATDEPMDDPQVLAPGESGELTRSIDNAGYLPVVVATEPASSGVAVDPASQTVSPRSEAETTVTLTAPTSEGEYVRSVAEYRYLALLPPSVLLWLHGVHPYLAVGAVNAVITAVVVGLVVGFYGRGDLRLRQSGEQVPFGQRLRRKLRRWR